MLCPLYLTKRNSETNVIVNAKVVRNLKSFHIAGVRFLYHQCFNKGLNAILNNDPGMNEPRQIFALLSATKSSKPTLIICPQESLQKWNYEFTYCSGLKVEMPKKLIETNTKVDVLLSTPTELKYIKDLSIDQFQYLIIDDLDLLINERYIKTLVAQFRIGITSRNFVVKPNAELQWELMKWANPKLIEDKGTFIERNQFQKESLLNPYPDYWGRFTWYLFENDKLSDLEIMNYYKTVNDWHKKNNIELICQNNNNNKKNNQKRSEKRKLEKSVAECLIKRTRNKPTRNRNIPKDIMEEIKSNKLEETNKETKDEDKSTKKWEKIKSSKLEGNNKESKYDKYAKFEFNNREIVEEIKSNKLEENNKETKDEDKYTEFELNKHVVEIKKIKNKDKYVKSEDTNEILDSICENSSSCYSSIKKEKKTEESCPILDMLLL